MRYLVSPEFTSKLAALSPSDIEQITRFLRKVESSNKTQLLEEPSHQARLLAQDVFVSRLGLMRIYFTFGDDAQGDFVLLLDATTEEPRAAARSLFAAKDPKTNSSLNPALNASINPKFNASLNPAFNASINPKFNASLNPAFNASINPKFNASLNPALNASINPKFNASLNPAFNASINPRMNSAFGGPYLYTPDLRQEGYLVRANDNVELLFDLFGNYSGQLVRASDGVRIQFNIDGEWEGYLVRANNEVALRYDLDGAWIGLVA